MEFLVLFIFMCYYSLTYFLGAHFKKVLIVSLSLYIIGILYFLNPLPSKIWEIIVDIFMILIFCIETYFIHRLVYKTKYNFPIYIILTMIATIILGFINLFVLLLIGLSLNLEGL